MQQLMTRLKLARVRDVYEAWLERATQDSLSYRDFLEGLLQEEILAREENQLRRRLKLAGFPFEKTIDQFDFSYRPELKKQVILRYVDDSFITAGESLVLVGPAGLGKTHLSVAIGLKMVQRGYVVRFITVQALLNQVLARRDLEARQKVLKPLLTCDLLILDELGYLSHPVDVGPLLYEVIAGRYEHKATIITSNKSLSDWSRVLHDSALAAALIDRLMHHGEVFYLKGESYRLKDKRGLALGKELTTETPLEESKRLT
jgi:DNA replication protein DnaC